MYVQEQIINALYATKESNGVDKLWIREAQKHLLKNNRYVTVENVACVIADRRAKRLKSMMIDAGMPPVEIDDVGDIYYL